MDFAVLEHLLNAPNKDFIIKLLNDVFIYRDSNIPDSILKNINVSLELENEISEMLVQMLKKIIKTILFDGLTDASSILAIFPDSFTQTNLKNLVAKLLAEQLPRFKKSIIDNQNMLPKLIEFDWRLDVKMSQNLSTGESDSLKSAGQQACILQLKNNIKQRLKCDLSNICELGIQTFFARSHPNDKCGPNGLPLTPNSIRIYGRFQILKELYNKNLCRYVDIQRGNQERLFVIMENYTLKISDILTDTHLFNMIMSDFSENNLIFRWFYQILNAHKFLHDHQIVNKCLNLENLVLDENLNIKLNNYGLYYMTEYGNCVSFQIGDKHYLPPEYYLIDFLSRNNDLSDKKELLNNPKIDVWSIGLCFFKIIFYQKLNKNKLDIDFLKLVIQTLRKFQENPETNDSLYESLVEFYDIDQLFQQKTENRWKFLVNIIKKCLTINLIKRPCLDDILKSYDAEIFKRANDSSQLINLLSSDSINDILNTRNFFNTSCGFRLKAIKQNDIYERCSNNFWSNGVDQIYYLWRLTGGDCLQIVKSFSKRPQVTSIYKTSKLVTVEDGCEYGKPINNEKVFEDRIIPISLKQLKNRLQSINEEIFYPLIEIDNKNDSQLNGNDFNFDQLAKQPLNIRESDIEYQLSRIKLFSRLLSAYPYKKAELYKECRVDIPPLYRAHAWASLLGVKHDFIEEYEKIDKEQVTPTDRQIDVDIPRCHQYDTLMASPEAHYKLKRVLKSWVTTNKNQLVYWQGLDSLCAPFLYLNFNNEALAYACLNNFIKKYAAKFFLQDNSEVIHEYLQVFSHLIAFHDPLLANHFEEIDFRPDLYAIPWFLTMFAHIFPLYKIFHLWDTLLLGSQSFPLCIGVSILIQLRNLLLNSDFNECILLFSELPEINISKCVKDSVAIFCSTPASCLYRKHSNYEEETNSESGDYDITSLSLNEMRLKLCPNISARDIDEFNKTPKPAKLIFIDIRSATEYAANDYSIQNSKNFPFELIKFDKLKTLAGKPSTLSDDINVQLVKYLNDNNDLVKIVASSCSRLNDAIEIANNLVKLKFSKICILHKGLESFNSSLRPNFKSGF